MLAGGITQMAFGDRVRAWRERRGIKQAELARRSGLDTATISRIERNKQTNPTTDTVQRLAAALGIKPVELMQDGAAAPAIEKPPRAVLQEVLTAQQVAVVETDWPVWSEGMRRHFLRELEGLRAAQAAVEEARRKVLDLGPLPETRGPDLPGEDQKTPVGA